jgi:hypothetical protein
MRPGRTRYVGRRGREAARSPDQAQVRAIRLEHVVCHVDEPVGGHRQRHDPTEHVRVLPFEDADPDLRLERVGLAPDASGERADDHGVAYRVPLDEQPRLCIGTGTGQRPAKDRHDSESGDQGGSDRVVDAIELRIPPAVTAARVGDP